MPVKAWIKMVCIWQPKQHDRTRVTYHELASLRVAEHGILLCFAILLLDLLWLIIACLAEANRDTSAGGHPEAESAPAKRFKAAAS